MQLLFLNTNEFKPDSRLSIFGVKPVDPGYIYVVMSDNKIKVGRSTSPRKRLREAKTWLPDAQIIGVKPFWCHTSVEQSIHIGLASFWYDKEWYDFQNDEFFETFLDEIKAFSNSDINSNSIDFIYFMNGSGMSEFTLEQSGSQESKMSFLKKCSFNPKKTN